MKLTCISRQDTVAAFPGDGLPCGVLDPDFADPLDGKLVLERGFRYTIELECEDESLNFSRVVGSVRSESRDVLSGFGLAIMEVPMPGQASPAPVPQDIRILVFTSEPDRDALASLLESLQNDHRSFRRHGASIFACLPGASNCLAGCVKPLRKAPTLPHEISELSARLAARSGEALGRTRVDKEGCTVNLDEFKAFAKQMFDRQANTAATMRALLELDAACGAIFVIFIGLHRGQYPNEGFQTALTSKRCLGRSGSLGDLSSAFRQPGPQATLTVLLAIYWMASVGSGTAGERIQRRAT